LQPLRWPLKELLNYGVTVCLKYYVAEKGKYCMFFTYMRNLKNKSM